MNDPTTRTDARPASGTVHWVGTGRSTGSGLAALADTADVVLWGRSAERTAACLDRTGLTGRVPGRDLSELAGAVAPGDVVVSMIPAAEHTALLRTCLERGAHFACTSYTSPEMLALAPAARESGTVVLTESGLDPGIDHLLAHDLVERARRAVGDRPATARLRSWCGGLPAEPGEFRYRFSWAPVGVLTALLSPARFVHDGQVHDAGRPWEHTRALDVAGRSFEVYPNRDSLPFVEVYDLPDTWRTEEFVRGTLRWDGWRDAWADVFDVVAAGDLEKITALAGDLAERYPMSQADRDRVVLSVDLDVVADDGTRFTDAHVLDMTGDASETAMARCVSATAACGVRAVLDGRLAAGVNRAARGAEGARWLHELRTAGVPVPDVATDPVRHPSHH